MALIPMSTNWILMFFLQCSICFPLGCCKEDNDCVLDCGSIGLVIDGYVCLWLLVLLCVRKDMRLGVSTSFGESVCLSYLDP